MPRRPRLLAPGLVYHVIARGNHREPIFLQSRDYRAYLARLKTYRHQARATLYAYCLMPNHVHLLIQAGEVPLSNLMQGIQQSYTGYFNRAYATVGHLFQGRYKARPCDKDGYLTTLVRYIHLNPVRAGLATRPDDYSYSSHAAYLAGKPADLVDPRPVLGLLGGREQYCRFVDAGPTADPDPFERDMAVALESDEARSRVTRTEPLRATDGETRWRSELPTALLQTLVRKLGADPGSVLSAERSWKVTRVRSIVAYTLVRRWGYPIAPVAAALGRAPTSVAVMLYRLGRRLEHDPVLAAEVTRLQQNV